MTSSLDPLHVPNWQKVAETAPQIVQDVASSWLPLPGHSRFEVFYGYNRALYCICGGPSTSHTEVFWIELPYID
jgi:hypothetical protein